MMSIWYVTRGRIQESFHTDRAKGRWITSMKEAQSRGSRNSSEIAAEVAWCAPCTGPEVDGCPVPNPSSFADDCEPGPSCRRTRRAKQQHCDRAARSAPEALDENSRIADRSLLGCPNVLRQEDVGRSDRTILTLRGDGCGLGEIERSVSIATSGFIAQSFQRRRRSRRRRPIAAASDF
jgi:hypothetical protein